MRTDFLDALKDEKVLDSLSAVLDDTNPQEPNLFGESLRPSARDLMYATRDRIASGKSPYAFFTREESGKVRSFAIPLSDFGQLIKDYVLPLTLSKEAHGSAHGYEVGWSPRRSLATHLPIESGFSFDLKDALPSVSYDMVFNFYRTLLNGRQAKGNVEEMARILATLATVSYGQNRGLAVGSPLSNGLFNRVLFPLDEKLAAEAQRRKMTYTRWGDDFTFTSHEDLPLGQFAGCLGTTEGFGLRVNPKKTYFQRTADGMVFLLGEIIINGRDVVKNSDEFRLKHKIDPLRLEDLCQEGKLPSWG